MKIVAPIYSNKNIDLLLENIDVALLNIPYFSMVYEDLEIDPALISCKKHNVEALISINRIFLEDELETVKNFIEKYKDYGFVISDLGVAQICKDLGLLHNIIFDSPTMVCNSYDLKLYSSFGFKAVSISNEITIEDVKNYSLENVNIYYQVFGNKLMFYTKRKLVDLYKEFRKLNFENINLSLKEEKRIYDIPIIQTKNGTFVYRNYLISQLEHINDFKSIKYLYFESLFLDLDRFIKVVQIYKKVINGSLDIKEGLNQMSSLDLNIEEGFNFLDSIHTKEKIIQ